MESLINWVNLKIKLSKEFSNFELTDVLESLLLQSLSTAVGQRNVAGLHRLGQIMNLLTSKGPVLKMNKLSYRADIQFS